MSKAEQRFALMLGKLQQPGNPARVPPVPMVFDAQEPLQCIRLALIIATAASPGLGRQGFTGKQLAGHFLRVIGVGKRLGIGDNLAGAGRSK